MQYEYPLMQISS